MSFPADHVCIVAKTRGSLQFDMSGNFSMFMTSIYQQKHRWTSIFPALVFDVFVSRRFPKDSFGGGKFCCAKNP